MKQKRDKLWITAFVLFILVSVTGFFIIVLKVERYSDRCRKHVDTQSLLIFCRFHDTHEHADADSFWRIVIRIDKVRAFFCVKCLAVVFNTDENIFILTHDSDLYHVLFLIRIKTVLYYSETQLLNSKCSTVCLFLIEIIPSAEFLYLFGCLCHVLQTVNACVIPLVVSSSEVCWDRYPFAHCLRQAFPVVNCV